MAPRLVVREGDITTYRGDAIVNAANNWLRLGAGVAGAIRRAGGPAIQRECDEHGPIKVGEAAVTGAGNLPVKWVIHAAALGDQPASEESIRESTAASVRLAVEHGVKRLAFPVLGTGVGGFDFARAAQVMLDAVRRTPEAERLEEIALFGFLPLDAETLQQMIEPS